MTAHTPISTTVGSYSSQLIVAARPGIFWGLTGYNSKSSSQWIQVHDSATAPADTAVPKVTFLVGALTPFSLDFPRGRYFANGIYVCNSSTGPTKTIGAADIWVDAQYSQ